MPSKYVYIDDVAINYFHHGETTLPDVLPDLSKGQRLLICHGAGGNGHPWSKNLPGIGQKHSPVAVDLPAHGRSGGLESPRTIADYCAFIDKFVDALQLSPFVFLGHSMGGGIAIEYALVHPEKLKGIILVGTGAKLRVLPERLEQMKRVMEGKEPVQYDRWSYSPKTSMDIVRQGWMEQTKTDPRIRYYDFLACDAFNRMSDIQGINVPTLVICGTDDVLTPMKYAEYTEKNIPGAKLVRIEDAGHSVAAEKTEQFNEAVIEFLDSLS
jgi:pimeloyl-ACP methyl ester carboxylesterase